MDIKIYEQSSYFLLFFWSETLEYLLLIAEVWLEMPFLLTCEVIFVINL